MTVRAPMLRSMIDDGASLFPNARSDASRKALIVLSSPYLLVRHARRRLHGDSAGSEHAAPVGGEVLDYTEMFVTSHCNLRCTYCSASIPYYLNKYHIDFGFLERQFKAYEALIGGVDTFRILGGEPFLHPSIADIVGMLAASDKVRKVRIVTNGTVVPKGERLLEQLRNEKVALDVSNYGPVSDKVPELEEMGRRGLLHLNVDTVTSWFYPNHVYNDQDLPPEAVAERFHSCPDYCHVLRDGKFFSCGEAFHIANVPGSPMRAGVDYVDLFDEAVPFEEKRRMVADVAFKRLPTMAGCGRCGGGSFIHKDRVLVAGEQPAEGEEVDVDLPADIPVVSAKMI